MCTLTVRPPAVLIIPNQWAPGVRRQSCLPSSTEAKEQCHIAPLAHVAAAVQGQDAALGHQVVHHTAVHNRKCLCITPSCVSLQA